MADDQYLQEEREAAKKIGAVIREVRRSIGMNQTHLARELGISGQGLWKYENGKTALMASQVAEIANILRVPVARLFGERAPLQEIDADLNADLEELNAAWQVLQSKKLRKATLEFVKQIANECECDPEKA